MVGRYLESSISRPVIMKSKLSISLYDDIGARNSHILAEGLIHKAHKRMGCMGPIIALIHKPYT